MERRRLLQDLVVGTAALLIGVLPYGIVRLLAPGSAAPQRNHLRPPGALKGDAAFVAACIGCGLCGEVCPPRCIRFHTRDGGDAVNTPYIDPEKARVMADSAAFRAARRSLRDGAVTPLFSIA